MLRFLIILSFVGSSFVGCNFTMEPDPGFSGDEMSPTALDARVHNEGFDMDLSMGGDPPVGQGDMGPFPHVPEEAGDGGVASHHCPDAGPAPDRGTLDAGLQDSGLPDGAITDGGMLCDMTAQCGDAEATDADPCAPPADGGVDGG